MPRKTLSDLGALTGAEPETPAPETPETTTPETTTPESPAADAPAAEAADAPAPGAGAPPGGEAAPAEAPPAEAAAPEAPRADRGEGDGRRRGRDAEETNKDGVETQGPQSQAVLREQQLDKQGRAYATGR